MQNKNPVMLAVKMQFIEQLANGFENTAIFRLACTINQDKKFNPDEVFEKAKNRMFPEGIEKAIVSGYDYMVLKAYVDGNEILIKPGTIIFVREDSHVGVITTSDGVPDVSIRDGELIVN
ncbi:hypothetical protein JA33_045 [Dickeya phage vB_DsoM_JA33]|uniref:Uncharacterized protein n=3 Tax=Salmondvirus JA11 TaxID=2734141 RepID=A0A384ZW30_9CAUD|nr:hypothetical protein HOU32_gp045 [Dickeya phage vB_DsoM_JA11]AXG66450.1 hypothetical protein JA13_047 [Dickeya phage vB_DsoM_JA13]AXG67419.1 hypothetical protein JA33_045 [Dickeya phage vB_DsoM_JA33]AYD79850.1 hypothetical protein JA11_045 [Dickeya phage vB_DsoM_JA11]